MRLSQVTQDRARVESPMILSVIAFHYPPQPPTPHKWAYHCLPNFLLFLSIQLLIFSHNKRKNMHLLIVEESRSGSGA